MSKYCHTFGIQVDENQPVIRHSLQSALDTYDIYVKIKECLYPKREVYLIDGETGEILMSTDDKTIYD